MREVFGDGRVVAVDGGFGIEAPGLHAPAPLHAGADGTAVPDLTEYVGKVIRYTGLLRCPGDNLETLAIHFAEILDPPYERPVSPMWALVSGNLGKKAELNPSKDRYSTSIAYDKTNGSTSWLRIVAYTYLGVADLLADLDGGTGLIAYGELETYDYNGKPRCQLALNGMQLLQRSTAPKPPVLIASARSAADIAPHAFDDAA